jgi:hypothetical protein
MFLIVGQTIPIINEGEIQIMFLKAHLISSFLVIWPDMGIEGEQGIRP